MIAVLTAAAETGPPGSGDQLTIILGGIATAFIAGVVTIVVTVINARSKGTEHTTTPGPTPVDTTGLHEDVAVLRYRADDADESREIVDRRLDQIERHLDVDNPRWRHGDR